MRKLLVGILVLMMGMPVMGRPNWQDLTDGQFVFVVWKLEETYMALNSHDKEEHCVFMDRVSDSRFVIADGYPDNCPLPAMYHVGDSVWRMSNESLFFFDEKGKLYASMKPFRVYGENPAEEVRRQDSLRLIGGCYESVGGRQLRFHLDYDGNPVLSVDEGDEEPIRFMKDVVVGERTLMHIRTPKRRWLLELTGEGMNVYSAVWNKTKHAYVRGNLLRRAKYTRPMEGDFRYRYDQDGLPLADIMMRYCPKEMFVHLRDELEPVKTDGWLVGYYDLYGRIIAH